MCPTHSHAQFVASIGFADSFICTGKYQYRNRSRVIKRGQQSAVIPVLQGYRPSRCGLAVQRCGQAMWSFLDFDSARQAMVSLLDSQTKNIPTGNVSPGWLVGKLTLQPL